MNFSDAFATIREDKSGMRLSHWSPEVHITVQRPDENSQMTHEYLHVTSRHGVVPWIPTQVELFSDKWEIVS